MTTERETAAGRTEQQAQAVRVTDSDRALLRIIEGYMRGKVSREKGYAYPSLVELAARAGVSVPTIKRRIARLIKAALLIAERPDRRYRNRYRLPAVDDPSGAPGGIKSEPPEGSKVSPRRAHFCTPGGIKSEPPEGSFLIPPNENKEEQREEEQTQQQQSGAAAEDRPSPNARTALIEAGLPENVAQPYADADAGGLCQLAAAYYAERAAQTACTLGLLRDMLNRPAEYFAQDDAGTWQPPRDSMIHKNMREAEIAYNRAAAADRRRRAEEARAAQEVAEAPAREAQRIADAAAWDALPESDRRGIEAGVAREYPVLDRTPFYPDGLPTIFRRKCYGWMRRLAAATARETAWHALSDAQRAAIEAEGRRRFPLWAARGEAALHSICLMLMPAEGGP